MSVCAVSDGQPGLQLIGRKARGLALDGLEEPAFAEVEPKATLWRVHAEIPPILVARLRAP